MTFDPKYTEITFDHANGHGFILRDTRTGKTKRVRGVTGHIHNVFNKNSKTKDDPAMTTFGEAALRKGTSIHQEVSAWVDSPRIFNKMSLDAQTAASMLVAQFPPSQGWVYNHDVPVSDYKKFASEIDLTVTNTNTGEVHIIDLKTGKWRGSEYNAQLSFYKRMWELGNPDQKVSGIWGLRTQEGSRGFVRADEFTPNQLDSIFYKGVRPKRVVNMNKGVAARQTNVLEHFEPATKQSGSTVSRPVTFFDVETGPHNEPIQLAAVKGVFNKQTGKFQIIDKFTRYFTGDPSTYASQEWAVLQELHGITPETAALRGKKYGRWGERHLNAFKAFIGDSVLAGHNIEEFDIPTVFGQQSVSNDIIDTLHIARNIRGQGVNKLGQLFALTTGQSMRQAGFSAHDALGDVMANTRMFEGWLNRKGSPFQEYSELVLNNPGMSTIRKNTYTGAMVRMKDEEMTPEDLLSMNIGTGMGFEDLSDMLDEERSTRLDNTAPPDGWYPAGGAGWGYMDIAELKALVNRQTHLTASLGEFTNSLSTSVFNHTSQIRNNMLRSMVDYSDDDARKILQRMYGDAEVERNVDTIKTIRRAKYRGWANREIEKAAARGIDLTKMDEFHDLNMVAKGETHSFTVDPNTGAAINTPLDGRATVLQARVDIAKLLGSQGAINKAKSLARYAEYHGLNERAAALSMVKNEDDFFRESMAYNEDRRRQYDAELLSKQKHETVRDMLYEGHQAKSAQLAALAESEDELWRARKQGQKELEKYNKTFDTFNKALSTAIAAPGQFGAGHAELQEKMRSTSRYTWGATGGFMPKELQPAGGYLIDSAFDMYKYDTVRRNTGLQIGSNIASAAATGALSMVGFGPIAMGIGAAVGGASQIIPSIFQSKEAKMTEGMSYVSSKFNLWSGLFTIMEAPFKMLARVTKDLTRSFLGLSASIAGIMLGGLNKLDSANEHYASLTSLTHGQYQDTFSMDAWLGLKEGSIVSATEDAVANMRTFLTSGEGQHKWANLALSNSLSGYLAAGDYEGVMNMVNDVVAQGHANPERRRDIMSNFIAAFGKGVLSDMVQSAWTHGVDDVRQFGNDARAGIHYRNIDDYWQGRINDTRSDWKMTIHGFDNAWMKVTVRMWEAFGRDISNSALDIANAFGDRGLAGGFDELKKKFKSLWEAFNSDEGLFDTGINLDGLVDMGKKILAAIMNGLASAIDVMQPFVLQSLTSLTNGILSLIAGVAGKVEPILAYMSTFEINPNLFAALAAVVAGDYGKAFLYGAKAKEEGLIRSHGTDVNNGVVNEKAEIDMVKYSERTKLPYTSYNYLRKHAGTSGKISADEHFLWMYNYAYNNKNDKLTLLDGTSISYKDLYTLRGIANGTNRDPALTEEGIQYAKDMYNYITQSMLEVAIMQHNHGSDNWTMGGTMDYRNLAHGNYEMIEDYIHAAKPGLSDAVQAGATLMMDGAASTLRHGANMLTIGIEAKDDRLKVTAKDTAGNVHEIVTKTGSTVKDIFQLNIAARSSAAEGVH